MKFGSLFSGVGGFDLGFERAGMDCAWQAEKDKYALQVLASHWPAVKRYEDVRDVGRNAEAVDLICGGFPCQDLSVAGKRAGLAGERSGLWFEFSRIIGELAPTWVVIENVPGLLSSNGGRDFRVVLDQMVQHGYSCAWRVLDSQWFGVAQRRRRVFIVGNLGDATAAAKVLFEPESRDWDSAPRRKTRKVNPPLTATGVGAGRTGNERNELDFAIPVYDNGQGDPNFDADKAFALNSQAHQGVYVPEYMVEAMDVRNLRSNGEVSGTLASKKSGGYSLNYQNPIAFHPRRTELTPLDDLSPTQNTGGGGGGGPAIAFSWDAKQITSKANRSQPKNELSHTLARDSQMHVGVRRLTPIECERLQGFPDRWTEGQSDTQRYRQMGNAVTVNVANWIGKRIVEVSK